MHSTTTVTTTCGSIRGKEKNGLLYFEGIPYGADTSGENRFLPPKPAKAWNGVLDCTNVRAKSCQAGGDVVATAAALDEKHPLRQAIKQLTALEDEVITQHEPMSEDCLHLNVLTSACDNQKRPVLVYIHGGAFMTGSGFQALGAGKLCAEEDVVVVGVNERLAAFDYLYLGHLSEKYRDSGNLGLLDIVLALRWVQDNIARFGGDPDNVTVIGESGGGMKICALLAMEEAKGLFHKAVCVSGVMAAGFYSKEDAAAVTDRLLEKLEIDRNDWEKILAVPASEIIRACEGDNIFMDGTVGFTPVGDDIHIPANPEYAFKTYPWSKDIPVIAGSGEDEDGMLFPEVQMTKERAIEKLRDGGKIFPTRHLPMPEETAAALYQTVESEAKPGTPPWVLFVKAVSQVSTLGHGAQQMLAERSKSGAAPCFLYNTSHPVETGLGPMFKCAWHTAELMGFFRAAATEEDEALSKVQGRLLSQFMHTGSPYEETYRWEPYDLEKDMLLNLDTTVSFIKDPLHSTRAMGRELNPKHWV